MHCRSQPIISYLCEVRRTELTSTPLPQRGALPKRAKSRRRRRPRNSKNPQDNGGTIARGRDEGLPSRNNLAKPQVVRWKRRAPIRPGVRPLSDSGREPFTPPSRPQSGMLDLGGRHRVDAEGRRRYLLLRTCAKYTGWRD